MKTLKHLLSVLAGIVVLPAFMILGVVAVVLVMRFVYWPVDETDPPDDVTVLGDWRLESGERYCRPFAYGELTERLDTLEVSFRLSPADLERCLDDLADYHDARGFRHVLYEGERGDPSYWFSVLDSVPELALEVTRSSGDVTFTATRYRVRKDGSIGDMSRRAASSGGGVFTLALGALAGSVLWLFWAVGRVYGWFRGNPRKAPPTS